MKHDGEASFNLSLLLELSRGSENVISGQIWFC